MAHGIAFRRRFWRRWFIFIKGAVGAEKFRADCPLAATYFLNSAASRKEFCGTPHSAFFKNACAKPAESIFLAFSPFIKNKLFKVFLKQIIFARTALRKKYSRTKFLCGNDIYF